MLFNKELTELIKYPAGNSSETYYVPDSVKSIDAWAFSGCIYLTSVNIPQSVTSIGSRAFYECKNLKSIDIPKSISSISPYAFCSCTNLADLIIPDSVTIIEDYAFSYCYSLKEAAIPKSVKSIGSGAFSRCSSLTSVTIPDGVESIGVGAFENCSSLTEINIPESVTDISGFISKTSNGGTVRINERTAFSGTPWYNARKAENPLVIYEKPAYNRMVYHIILILYDRGACTAPLYCRPAPACKICPTTYIYSAISAQSTVPFQLNCIPLSAV